MITEKEDLNKITKTLKNNETLEELSLLKCDFSKLSEEESIDFFENFQYSKLKKLTLVISSPEASKKQPWLFIHKLFKNPELKVLKIYGFYLSTNEWELITQAVKNNTCIEQLVFDTANLPSTVVVAALKENKHLKSLSCNNVKIHYEDIDLKNIIKLLASNNNIEHFSLDLLNIHAITPAEFRKDFIRFDVKLCKKLFQTNFVLTSLGNNVPEVISSVLERNKEVKKISGFSFFKNLYDFNIEYEKKTYSAKMF